LDSENFNREIFFRSRFTREQRRLYFLKASPRDRKFYLDSHKTFRRLPSEVKKKISSFDEEDLRRLWYIIQGIMDNFILSFDETITKEGKDGSTFWSKWYRWILCTAAFSISHVVKCWKNFCTFVKARALLALHEVKTIRGIPFFNTEGVFKCPVTAINEIINNGVDCKCQMTKVCHLTATRNLPADRGSGIAKSAIKHAETICSSSEVSKERLEIIFRLSRRIGRRIYPYVRKTDRGHVSLTTSAALETPVSLGGRATTVGMLLREWAEEVSTENLDEISWMGPPYRLEAGKPRWKTLFRIEGRDDQGIENARFLDERFMPTISMFSADPMWGIDGSVGLFILQWAIEYSIDMGYMGGSKYFDPRNPLVVKSHPPIKTSTIGEPGLKSRTITVAEAWLTIFLQPYSHQIGALLSNYKPMRSGFTRSAHLYEFVKELVKSEPTPGHYWLTSDLETATDYCEHSIIRASLEGLNEGLRLYNRIFECSKNLLSTGRIIIGTDNRMAMKLGYSNFIGRITKRASLMGDPGTKNVLMLFNALAEEEALIRYQYGVDMSDHELLEVLDTPSLPTLNPTWRHRAFAGDDHIAVGPKEYLREITKTHERNKMVVSWEKNFFSPIGAFYCEEAILQKFWKGASPKHLWEIDYFDQPHVDAIKMRLLSPCSKVLETQDEKNPAIGKGFLLQKKLEWLPPGFEGLRSIATTLFYSNFGFMIDQKSALCYLPKHFGGFHLPLPEDVCMEEEVLLLSPVVKKALYLQMKGELNFTATEFLKRVSSNRSIRGYEADGPAREMIFDALRDISLSDQKHIDDLSSIVGMDIDKWRHLGWSQKKRLARNSGYLARRDVLFEMDRPCTFYDILSGKVRPRAWRNATFKDRQSELEEQLSGIGILPISAREEILLLRGTQDILRSRGDPSDEFFLSEGVLENLMDLKVKTHQFL
jgi:hypothetical protein